MERTLLITQRLHRVHVRGTTSRDECRHEGHCKEQERHGNNGYRVTRLHFIEETPKNTRVNAMEPASPMPRPNSTVRKLCPRTSRRMLLG